MQIRKPVFDSSSVGSTMLELAGNQRPFYYRTQSTDWNVAEQVFGARQYFMGRFPQSVQLQQFYERIVAGGRTPLIVDAGANIGASTVWFCAGYPGSHVVAIEPEAENCALLRRNCQGLSYSLIEGGIGCVSGESYLSDPGVGEWGYRLAAESGKYPVRVIAAAEIVSQQRQNGLVPFLFKIDIEGGEAELFRENFAWVSEFAVVIIELHDWLLPGTSNSRNFRKAIDSLDIDFVHAGENVFVFNRALLV